MALAYDRLKAWPFRDVEQTYDEKDTILYALGIGLGGDPTDPGQLRFVYERELEPLPTMPVVLGHPGFFLSEPEAGVDWKKLLHGEQRVTLHAPLPSAGRVVSTNRVEEIVDKGEGRGALVYTVRETRDAGSGALLATQNSTLFLRGDGGFGGPAGPVKPVHTVPDGAHDDEMSFRTLPQAALIYRLSGDRNPIHADPEIAAQAGFDRPILHGLCTFGIAGYALMRTLCESQPARVRHLEVRFSRPVFPGETITTRIWREGEGKAAFRCFVDERDVVVIDNGYCEYAA
jgi:acyl dehydratase